MLLLWQVGCADFAGNALQCGCGVHFKAGHAGCWRHGHAGVHKATLCGTVSHGHVETTKESMQGSAFWLQGRQRCCMAFRAAITTMGSTREQCGLTNLGLVDSTTIEVCCRAETGRVRAKRQTSGQCEQMHAPVQQPGWRGGEAEQCAGTRCSAGDDVYQAERGAHAARVTIVQQLTGGIYRIIAQD